MIAPACASFSGAWAGVSPAGPIASALSTALCATIATVLPLVLPPRLGLAELAYPAAPLTSRAALQREAAMTVANADAGFQPMLAEPTHRTALVAAGYSLLVYLHRLCRHAIALSAQRGVASVPQEPLARLRRLLGRRSRKRRRQ
jgi:hypothetical protein